MGIGRIGGHGAAVARMRLVRHVHRLRRARRSVPRRGQAFDRARRGETVTVVELAKSRIWQRARTADRPGAGVGTRSYYLVLVVAGVLLGFGLVMIMSASSVSSYARFGSSFLYFKRQLVWAAIGVVGMFLASRIDYRRWRGAGWILLL